MARGNCQRERNARQLFHRHLEVIDRWMKLEAGEAVRYRHNLLVTSHHKKGLIGNTGIIKKLQDIGYPLILVGHSV